MDIMVIGAGGREHAIIKALRKSPRAGRIYCLPGNGGIAADAECVEIGAGDIPGICAFARTHGVGFAVVAPDDPLVLGAVDALHALGIPCFGPDKAAAAIEGSKIFAKELMKKYRIPTAAYESFDSVEEAWRYIDTQSLPLVVKADGLALGKGVVIARTREEAREAVEEMIAGGRFGQSGRRVVIEEFLTGPEVSVLSFTDGETLIPMVSSMDHKRALDGDRGPNTGGMGTVAPNPFYTPEIAERCMREIFLPTVAAMKAEGRPFRGCLYFGLMLTPQGPRVLEYNCRFGDPETQVVLPLLESDLLEIMLAAEEGRLKDTEVRFASGAACCVVMASRGYPQAYEKGFPITVDGPLTAELYAAGTTLSRDGLVTGGGRVLGVSARGENLAEAVQRAYENVEKVHFANAFYRKDIGRRALEA